GSISDPTPTLRATAQAKSGEEYEARLGVVFRVEREQPDRSWAVVGETVLPGAPGAVGDGSVLADTVRTELTGGVVYRYTAQTLAYSTGSLVSRSDWSAGCYFTVDRTPPAAPTIRFDGPYSECTSTSCPAAGGPGKTGTFTFGPGDGDALTGYVFHFSDEGTWRESANPTVTYAPRLSGTIRLSVRAKGRTGAMGPGRTVDFVVAP
ncbi:LamG domain protein jellyroll fold domain protein, partial [Streptomyces sp. 12297]